MSAPARLHTTDVYDQLKDWPPTPRSFFVEALTRERDEKEMEERRVAHERLLDAAKKRSVLHVKVPIGTYPWDPSVYEKTQGCWDVIEPALGDSFFGGLFVDVSWLEERRNTGVRVLIKADRHGRWGELAWTGAPTSSKAREAFLAALRKKEWRRFFVDVDGDHAVWSRVMEFCTE